MYLLIVYVDKIASEYINFRFSFVHIVLNI